MAHLTPVVKRRDTQRLDWLDWLDQNPLFRFQVGGFFVTFRREPQRQGEFWYAYKRSQGLLRKVYVGRAQDLTYDRLVETVEKLRYG
jgi:hypothetical protein